MFKKIKLPSLKSAASGWLALRAAGGEYTAIQAGQQRAPESLKTYVADDLRALRGDLKAAGKALSILMKPGDYVLLQAEAPAVPRAEWRDALRWKLKDMVDFPVADALFDLVEIPVEAYAPGRPAQCLVVVAQRAQVLAAVDPLQQAKIDIAAVDIPEMAQRNVAALFAEENRGVAMLAFDDAGALLTVTFHGELYGARRIDVAPVALQHADEFRRQQLLERVALETQRTLDAFDRQYSFMTVTRLVLAAPGNIEGIHEALTANLYIPVVPMDLGSVLDLSAVPELQEHDAQVRHLHLIGAALRDEATA